MKSLLILILIFGLNCKTKNEDCRTNNSCPIFYPKLAVEVFDTTGKLQDWYITSGQKIILLTSKEGKRKKVQFDEYFLPLEKILYKDKEFFIPTNLITLGDIVRVANPEGIKIKESPNDESKNIGEIPFNTKVEIFSHQERIDKKESKYYKVKSPDGFSNYGWVKISDLSDGDYDASLFQKKISELLKDVTIEFTELVENHGIKIKSLPGELYKPSCTINGKECYASTYIKDEMDYNKVIPYLMYDILLTPEFRAASSDFYCKLNHIELATQFQFMENNIFNGHISCESLNED
ncbi:MAG: hypothetical protein CK427_17225 [Leptospira sp.]|nr:MAG: hypothetical protein CK427_17225 [Leptospira sp.]